MLWLIELPLPQPLDSTSEVERWRQTLRYHLWLSRTEEVILIRLELADHHRNGSAALAAAPDFSNNIERLDYTRYRRQGYVLGSTTFESGWKQIGTTRLKRF